MIDEVNLSQPIIFTDLDGTLLDHDTHNFDAASQALEAIFEHNIPLIINSSKTSSEIMALQKVMKMSQPFICENGAAVYWPASISGQWNVESFVPSRKEILEELSKLRNSNHYQFIGFNDLSIREISELTGLSIADAELSSQRDFSEPLCWRDSENSLKHFLSKLHDKGILAHQGGRFLTVMGETNKAKAMKWVCENLYSGVQHRIIALGDSPNDAEMLNAADIAVIIKSNRSSEMKVEVPETVIRCESSGPVGWQLAMNQILPDFLN